MGQMLLNLIHHNEKIKSNYSRDVEHRNHIEAVFDETDECEWILKNIFVIMCEEEEKERDKLSYLNEYIS